MVLQAVESQSSKNLLFIFKFDLMIIEFEPTVTLTILSWQVHKYWIKRHIGKKHIFFNFQIKSISSNKRPRGIILYMNAHSKLGSGRIIF